MPARAAVSSTRLNAALCVPLPLMAPCRRSADRTRVYVASEEERAADAEQARQAAFMALGVVLGPVLIMGALLAGSR